MKIADTLEKLKNDFFNTSDLIIREFKAGGRNCALVFLDSGTDKELLDRDVIRPLVAANKFEPPYEESFNNLASCTENAVKENYNGAVNKIAEGDVALFLDGEASALIITLRKFDKRSIVEPPTSSVLKGPREGFIEEIKTNVHMIRRKIKSPNLVVRMLRVGKFSGTSIAVMYINGIADVDIANEIQKKIEAINLDGIIDSSYVAAYVAPHKNSIFNHAGTSEKPDVVAAKLLEGRIAIVVDGSPIVVTFPYVLFEDLQDGYDYYGNEWRTSFIRMFRLLGVMLTTILPAAYVALQAYHFHLLPIKFLTTILTATSGIPFPPAIEMLFVLLLFEILNQASIRLPRFMGISLSVVGAIVLGDTAVKAGLISSPTVLIIALSSIGIFCVPDQGGSTSILRIAFMLASAVLGFLGIIILMIIVMGYLAPLDNFGSPYLAPYAPRINPDLKDGMLKKSITDMDMRPFSIATKNRIRQRHKKDDGQL